MFSRKLISLAEYIFVFLVIISMRSVFVHIIDGQVNDRLIKLLILACVSLILFFNFKKIKFELSLIIGICIYYLGAMLLLLYNSFVVTDGLLAFIFNVLLLLPFFIVLCRVYYLNNDVMRLCSKYTNLIVIISLVSLFFWLFGSVLDLIKPNVELISTWMDENGKAINGYYYVYFETQRISLLGFDGWRNTSIFVEGPMYNIMLLISLAQVTFLDKKIISLKSIIILVSIFSILSTTGIFIAFFILFYKIYLCNALTKERVLFFIFLTPFLLYYAFMFLYDLALDKSESVSALMRWDDIYAGFMAWVSDPILGSGYTHLEAIFPYMNMSFRPNTGYSNGIFSSLVQGGVVLFLLYFLPLFVLLFNKNSSRDLRFTIFLWLILLFSTIVDNTPLFLFISAIAYALSLGKIRKGKLI